MPKQLSSFSLASEMNSSASPEVLEEELAADVSDLVARSCCITLKYSSSVLALASRDWAFTLWARKVLWALVTSLLGARRPLAESQVRTVASVNFDCSSNLDHHLTLKVLCKTSWVSMVWYWKFHIQTQGRKKFVQKQRKGGNIFSDSEGT